MKRVPTILVLALGLSALLHWGLYVNFIRVVPSDKPTYFEVEFREVFPNESAVLEAENSDTDLNNVPSPAPPVPRVKLKQLLPRYQLGAQGDRAETEGENSLAITSSPKQSRSQATYDAIGSSLGETLNHQSFFRVLAQRLDHSLSYPKDFVVQREDGQVSLQILVDQRGVFSSLVGIDASESTLLKAYTLAAAYIGLKDPLPQRYWAKQDQNYLITIIVEYSVETLNKNKSSIYLEGPVVRIKRVGHDEGRINQTLSKMYDKYVPPIIIYPGGFYVDFVKLYNWIEDFDAPDPDMLRADRLNMTKQALEQTVKEIKGKDSAEGT